MSAPDSLRDELVALDTLGRSRRIKPVALWLIGILSSAGAGGIGWIASKVDTLQDMRAIRMELTLIRTAQDRMRADLLSEDPPGRLLRLERGHRYVWRALIETRTAVYSGESAKMRAAKKQAGKDMGEVYERRLNDMKSPVAAYDDVIASVAIE